jgi:hypothetical protein
MVMIPSYAESDAAPSFAPPPTPDAIIALARAELARDCPEYQGANLLLHARETGPNVDRLARRTGYRREFVAQCLRRLVDNSCWVDGELRANWAADAAVYSAQFWLDVDVALGRCLKRINADGKPEWSPAGGDWVKDFNYRGATVADTSVHNEYYAITPYNPAPVDPVEVEIDPEPTPLRVEAPVVVTPPMREPPPVAEPVLMMADWAGADWLG